MPVKEKISIREKQREETRQRIIEAAIAAFAEFGFHGASTRDIAERAKTNQGLLTYHFNSKDELWHAATDQIFTSLQTALQAQMTALPQGMNLRERRREAVRIYVRFTAAHPELFRIMLDEGKGSSDRMKWLVKTHLKALYRNFGDFIAAPFDKEMLPHAFYVFTGASSLIFAIDPECRTLTGLNPKTKKAIETHADFAAQLLVP